MTGQLPPNLQPPNLPPPNLPPTYWQPPPVAKKDNGLTIVALVIGSLALLLVLGFVAAQIVVGFIFGGIMSPSGGFFPPGDGMRGTAPQVVAGQIYPGALLQDEVERVVGDNGGNVGSMSCPATQAVVTGAVTECHGEVDGSNWSYRVTFEDAMGHFTLDEKLS